MKELYEQLGISSQVYDFGAEIEESLKERFEQFDKTAEYNQLKVLMAMQKNKVSAECFQSSSGYGYDDFGRDTLEKVYADTFHTESVHRLPVAHMHLQLRFLEISVRVMNFLHRQENHMILWKR